MNDSQWLRQDLQKSVMPEEKDPWSDKYIKSQGKKKWKCVEGISWYQHKNHVKQNNSVFPNEMSHVVYDEYGVNKGMRVSWKEEGRPAPFDVVNNAPQKWLPSVLKGIFNPTGISMILWLTGLLFTIVEYLLREKALLLALDGISLMVIYIWLIVNGIILIVNLVNTYKDYIHKNLHYDSIITDADIWLLRRYKENWTPIIRIDNYDDGTSSKSQSMKENIDLLETGESIVNFRLNNKLYSRLYGAELGGTNFLYCNKDNPELIDENYYKRDIMFTSSIIRNLLVGLYMFGTVVLYIGTVESSFNEVVIPESIESPLRLIFFAIPIIMFIIGNKIEDYRVPNDAGGQINYTGYDYNGYKARQSRRMNVIVEELCEESEKPQTE